MLCTILYLGPKTVSLHSSYICKKKAYNIYRDTCPGVRHAVLFVSVMSSIQSSGDGMSLIFIATVTMQ